MIEIAFENPLKDADLISRLANFLTVANANLAPLGLIAGDLIPALISAPNKQAIF